MGKLYQKNISALADALSCTTPFKVRNCGNCNGTGFVPYGDIAVSCCYFCHGTGCLDPHTYTTHTVDVDYTKKSKRIDDLYNGE